MRHVFTAMLHNMAVEEARALVPAETIVRIKAAGDPNPKFAVYSIGHEGTANSTLVTATGKRRIPMQYFRDAVEKIGKRLKAGVKAFRRHGADNAHEGRTQVGEVVGKAVRMIDGITHALAAVHVFPPYRKEKLDVASWEADCTWKPDGEAFRLTDMDDITGLALSASDKDRPAFPGATLRAAFQCFAETLPNKGEGQMTLEEIQKAINEGKFTPDQVFGAEALLGSAPVKAKIEETTKSNQTAYEGKKAFAERLEKRLETTENARDKATARVATLEGENLRHRSSGVFSTVADERKLTEAQRKFADRNFSAFSSKASDENELKVDLNKWIDGQLKEYEVVGAIYGVKTKEDAGGKTEEGAGTGSGDGKGGGDSDLTDPKNNELIPAIAGKEG